MKSKYPLPTLLNRLGLSKSSYYYQEAVKKQPDKYRDICDRIRQLFRENKWEELTVSEKVVRQIIREEGFIVI